MAQIRFAWPKWQRHPAASAGPPRHSWSGRRLFRTIRVMPPIGGRPLFFGSAIQSTSRKRIMLGHLFVKRDGLGVPGNFFDRSLDLFALQRTRIAAHLFLELLWKFRVIKRISAWHRVAWPGCLWQFRLKHIGPARIEKITKQADRLLLLLIFGKTVQVGNVGKSRVEFALRTGSRRELAYRPIRLAVCRTGW
jgi:hypothetical protein